VYWTGMSHPANETMRAPAARWARFKGVLFVAGSVKVVSVAEASC
jgi:hypothetical protein